MGKIASGAAAGLVAFVLFSPAASARSGGPDGFGYTFRDSAEPGVTYAWEDISATGLVVSTPGDDLNFGFQPLSFAFPYYGNGYTQVACSSNGWASFVDGTSTTYFNEVLPAAGIPTGIVAAFWDDLSTSPATARVLFQDLGNRAVITWELVPDLGDAAATNTFQLVFFDDGRIKAQYQDLLGDRFGATAGLESPDEVHGLTAWSDDPAGIPATNYAIEYYPPVPVPADLVCAGARVLACGDRIVGDNRTGVANQDAYLCSRGDYAGREIVYELSFATPTNLRLILESSTGSQDMVVVSACDPNVCLAPPTDIAYLTNITGPVHVVVDSAPGQEGAFQLRVDCLPLAPEVDCANASLVACETTVTGDTALGQARQEAYGCSLADYAGREQVWYLDLRAPTRVEFILTELSGDPDLIVITNACDPNSCQVLDSGSLVVDDLVGTVYIVVDSAPGDEGQYELSLGCLSDNLAFCGDGLLEMDPWGIQNGVWLVNGWLYHPGDTHDFALRVDGTTAYSTGWSCPGFLTQSYGVRMPAGPAFVEWTAPEGAVRTELYQTSLGTCCGLMVSMTVTNTSATDHYYEYRIYHDTAFGTADGTGACFGTIDGGPVEVNGVRYESELDLLAVAGNTCAGQLQMFSGDHPDRLHSSFEMLGPNLPNAMEYLDWDDGGEPCTTWKGLADGANMAGCSDNSVLFIWRFPQFGTLAPGESATARYRIGLRCAWPCDVPCESPTLASASAMDAGPCQGGIRVSWSDAIFPGAGNGVYHVYSSTVSHADALLQVPSTPPGGISATTWVDLGTLVGRDYYYVVKAESLDFPNCGDGPAVLGSTATANAPAVQDYADVDPPTTVVGGALRAVGKTPSTVDFAWPLAPAPLADEHYVVLRSDDDPRGPFQVQGQPTTRSWTDPDAPPTYSPSHVWFYDVRVADSCGNIAPEAVN